MPSGYNFYIGTIIIAVINLLSYSKISLCSYLLFIIPGISLRLQQEGNWFCC